MRTRLLLAGALLLFGAVAVEQLAAQFNTADGIYTRSFYVERVFPHRLGYRIVYTNDRGFQNEMLIPLTWFGRGSGAPRAEMLEGRHPSYPYIEVFWEDGEFSHLRLYVRSDHSHESWGVWNAPENVEELFDIDEPDFNL